jgi:hypothetical protein
MKRFARVHNPALTMLDYQRPDTELTLAGGLREYYASRDGLVSGRGISDDAREFFRCHDAAHVVFGCTTTLHDEAVIKMWSFFGSTEGFGLLRGYRLAESQDIYEQLPWKEVARTMIESAAIVPRVVWRCRRMHKRWPWSEFEKHLDARLVELRREYGIVPLVRGARS